MMVECSGVMRRDYHQAAKYQEPSGGQSNPTREKQQLCVQTLQLNSIILITPHTQRQQMYHDEYCFIFQRGAVISIMITILTEEKGWHGLMNHLCPGVCNYMIWVWLMSLCRCLFCILCFQLKHDPSTRVLCCTCSGTTV